MTKQKPPVFRKEISRSEFVRVVRIEVHNLNKLLQQLEERYQPETIHEIRLILKRLRALYNLIATVDRRAYKNNTHCLRNMARHFAPARDREVVYGTLISLIKENPALEQDPATQKLLKEHEPVPEVRVLDGRVGHVNLTVGIDPDNSNENQMIPAAGLWLPEAEITRKVIARGITGTYQRCRQAWLRAMDSGLDTDFHRWRRSVKYLDYQLNYCKLRDESFRQRRAMTKQLGAALGRDHDLVMLKNSLRREHALDTQPLLDALTDQRQLLRLEEETLGETLFEPDSRAFRAMFKKAWKNRGKKQRAC